MMNKFNRITCIATDHVQFITHPLMLLIFSQSGHLTTGLSSLSSTTLIIELNLTTAALMNTSDKSSCAACFLCSAGSWDNYPPSGSRKLGNPYGSSAHKQFGCQPRNQDIQCTIFCPYSYGSRESSCMINRMRDLQSLLRLRGILSFSSIPFFLRFVIFTAETSQCPCRKQVFSV